MDANTIILVLAVLVAAGLIYRSVSSKPEKTNGGGGISPSPEVPDLVSELNSMTKAELLESAELNGIVVRKSWSKSRISSEIETHLK